MFRKRQKSPYDQKMDDFLDFIRSHSRITSHDHGDMLVMTFRKSQPIEYRRSQENQSLFIDEAVLNEVAESTGASGD